MNKFQVGDKVICIHQQTAGGKTINSGHVGTVTHVDRLTLAVDNMLGSGGSCVMFESAFELYQEEFQVGDRVRVLDNKSGTGGADGRYFKIGDTGTVIKLGTSDMFVQFDGPDCFGDGRWYILYYACTKIQKTVDTGSTLVQTTPVAKTNQTTQETQTMTTYKLPAQTTKLARFTDYEAAAKFLDDTFPNWHTKINLDKLDMTNWSHCILGQLRPHVSVDGKKLENTTDLVCYFFGTTDSCMGSASVFACRFAGYDTFEHKEKWKQMVKARHGTPLELELRAAKLKVEELERKVLEAKQAEERRRKPVTLTLTQDEVQLLLDRKPGAVRAKIEQQIKEQLV